MSVSGRVRVRVLFKGEGKGRGAIEVSECGQNDLVSSPSSGGKLSIYDINLVNRNTAKGCTSSQIHSYGAHQLHLLTVVCVYVCVCVVCVCVCV